jgi:hypothetical protein
MDVNFLGCPDVTDDGNKDGRTVLVCVKCGGLWDHSATDCLIDRIFSRASPEDRRRAGIVTMDETPLSDRFGV